MTNKDGISVEGLVERLRKVEGGPFPEGSIGTCWYRNPDGPEAANIILALSEREAAKDAEIARKDAALLAIREEADRTEGSWVHLKRVIGNHARAALTKGQVDAG